MTVVDVDAWSLSAAAPNHDLFAQPWFFNSYKNGQNNPFNTFGAVLCLDGMMHGVALSCKSTVWAEMLALLSMCEFLFRCLANNPTTHEHDISNNPHSPHLLKKAV